MENKEIYLSICIPTFNRSSIVDTVKALLPQLPGQAKIKIFDNCSDTPVADLLKGLMTENVEIVRNNVNVGAAGNIIKCFEYCDTEWMWLLSDDDMPLHNAVETILSTISQHPDTVYIKYNSDVCGFESAIRHDVISIGQKDFIRNIENFSNLLFISSTVCNTTEIRKAIKSAYYFTHTFSPHLAFILSYLGMNPEGKALFSPSNIVGWREPTQNTWNSSLVDKSISDFSYIIQGIAERRMLFSKISSYHPYKAPFDGYNWKNMLKTIVLSKTEGEEYNLIADYFSSTSFIYWSRHDNTYKHLLKSAVFSMLIFILYLPFVNKLIISLAKFKSNNTKFIYNRFALFSKDFRL